MPSPSQPFLRHLLKVLYNIHEYKNYGNLQKVSAVEYHLSQSNTKEGKNTFYTVFPDATGKAGVSFSISRPQGRELGLPLQLATP